MPPSDFASLAASFGYRLVQLSVDCPHCTNDVKLSVVVHHPEQEKMPASSKPKTIKGFKIKNESDNKSSDSDNLVYFCDDVKISNGDSTTESQNLNEAQRYVSLISGTQYEHGNGRQLSAFSINQVPESPSTSAFNISQVSSIPSAPEVFQSFEISKDIEDIVIEENDHDDSLEYDDIVIEEYHASSPSSSSARKRPRKEKNEKQMYSSHVGKRKMSEDSDSGPPGKMQSLDALLESFELQFPPDEEEERALLDQKMLNDPDFFKDTDYYKMFSSENDSHEKSHYPCSSCGKVFRSSRRRRSHYEVVHLEIMKYKCEFCSRKFGRLDNLKTHLKNIHKNPKRSPVKGCVAVNETTAADCESKNETAVTVEDGTAVSAADCESKNDET